MKTTAAEAGRDPDALVYARMGSLELSAEQVESLAEQGVTRIVVSAPTGETEEQCDQLTAFAERFGLGKD